MAYTLKLDWSSTRTQAVLQALFGHAGSEIVAMTRDLKKYKDVDATIKVAWPASWIAGLLRILRAGNPPQGSELLAAVHDIEEYRAARENAAGEALRSTLSAIFAQYETETNAARSSAGREASVRTLDLDDTITVTVGELRDLIHDAFWCGFNDTSELIRVPAKHQRYGDNVQRFLDRHPGLWGTRS